MDHPDLTAPNFIEYPIGLKLDKKISNSYTMACSPVRGDYPRALASELSYVHVDKHGITILYKCTTYMYIRVDVAHHEICCTKVGRGGVFIFKRLFLKVNGLQCLSILDTVSLL